MSTVPVTVAVATLVTLSAGQSQVHEGRETAEVSALIAAARAGDQHAFGSLVSMHQRVVYRTALAALGTREDAEDAAQEAFVVAWQKLTGFRGDSTFRTWLLTIVWRKALDRRRVRLLWRQRTAVEQYADAPAAIETLHAGTPDPERTVLASDAARRVREAIRALSPKLRDTLLLAASGEYSYDEIATILGIPLGTVKWRVAEARRLIGSQVDA